MEIVPNLKDKSLAKFIFNYVKDENSLVDGFEKYTLQQLLQNIRYEEFYKWLEEKVNSRKYTKFQNW